MLCQFGGGKRKTGHDYNILKTGGRAPPQKKAGLLGTYTSPCPPPSRRPWSTYICVEIFHFLCQTP